MTILEAIKSSTVYPVPVVNIEKMCIDRGLDKDMEYTQEIGSSQSYRLATADLYLFLYASNSITEQEVKISVNEKDRYKDLANAIYGEYDDPKYTGLTYGFIGEGLSL